MKFILIIKSFYVSQFVFSYFIVITRVYAFADMFIFLKHKKLPIQLFIFYFKN